MENIELMPDLPKAFLVFTSDQMGAYAKQYAAFIQAQLEAALAPVVTKSVYQVRQNVGRSIWADVSRAEYGSADRSPDNRRVLFTAIEQPVQPAQGQQS